MRFTDLTAGTFAAAATRVADGASSSYDRMVPAGCEIEIGPGRSCGITAVSRCTQCVTAFCRQHRNSYGVYAAERELCQVCGEARQQTIYADTERTREKAFDDHAQLVELARQLDLKHRGQAKQLEYQQILPSRWSRARTRTTYRDAGHGWLVKAEQRGSRWVASNQREGMTEFFNVTGLAVVKPDGTVDAVRHEPPRYILEVSHIAGRGTILRGQEAHIVRQLLELYPGLDS